MLWKITSDTTISGIKIQTILFLGLFSLLMISCSKDEGEDGPDYNDTLDPVISIIDPTNGDTISGAYMIDVDCSDDDRVSKVKYIMDREVLSIVDDAPFDLDILFTSDANGEHELQAMAYDRSNNAALSEPVVFTVLEDLSPDANSVIRAYVEDYVGDGTLDDDGPGDPYFIFAFYAMGDTTEFYSVAFLDSAVIDFPYNCDYDISDFANEFHFAFWVYDLDVMGSEWVDYTPESGGRAYQFTIPLASLPFDEQFNGSDDGNEDEPDCSVRLRLELDVE